MAAYIEKLTGAKMEIVLNRETKQILGQRMYQSMSLLQMGMEELRDYMHELSMENPLLDEKPKKEDTYIQSSGCRSIRKQNGQSIELPIPDKLRNTLKMSLEEQIRFLHLREPVLSAIRLLLLNLDDRGFLPKDIAETEAWRKEPQTFEEALTILQSLEPSGVGARSISECLCIQLARMGKKDSLAYVICGEHLQHLMKSHYNHISKVLNVEESCVLEAKKQIASLNPVPSNGFDDGKYTVWAVPDVEIMIEDGEPVVVKLDSYMPEYTLNRYYEQMLLRNDLSKEESEYLFEKIDQAKWALDCVERRGEMITACAQLLAREQSDFFKTGSNIRPLFRSDIAKKLGVHPSTISRTIKNKYIACRWGIVPMSRLFAQEVGGGTSDEITEMIKSLIREEDPAHPLSDNALSKGLHEKGFEISRRTVAKYRDDAGIPPATGRKKR